MNISKLHPLRGRILLEALFSPSLSSGLFLPPEAEERYPQLGRVLKTGTLSEDIREGDLCVVPNEGTFQGRTYWQVCFLVLKGESERVHCSFEIEPVVREQLAKLSSTYDPGIVVKTLDSESIHFNASDVLDYGLEDLSNPMIKLDYVPVEMLWDGPTLYYFVHEREVLLTLREE